MYISIYARTCEALTLAALAACVAACSVACWAAWRAALTSVTLRGTQRVQHTGKGVTDSLYTKGTRAHTHRELIREWLWKPKESSLEYF